MTSEGDRTDARHSQRSSFTLGPMPQDIYEAILAQAPSGSFAAAGNLNEDIWVELLRRSDPMVHNVRVTAGDGGIDGVGFQDPIAGLATVYQCKYFKELTSEHRADITAALVRACSHPFTCTTWVLLLPRQLSAPDLGWLMGQLRRDAIALVKKIESAKKVKATAAKSKAPKTKAPKLPRIALHSETEARLTTCEIRYRDGQDLEDLLRHNLDVAGRFLPDSALALADRLSQERAEMTVERSYGWDVVHTLRDEAIRIRQVDARRAEAAVGILNQGWGGLVERLRLTTVNERLPGAAAASVAADVEALAGARSTFAFQCEGLIPGASDAISRIFFQARMLQSTAGARDFGMADSDAVASVATTLRATIQELQALVTKFTRQKYRR